MLTLRFNAPVLARVSILGALLLLVVLVALPFASNRTPAFTLLLGCTALIACASAWVQVWHPTPDEFPGRASRWGWVVAVLLFVPLGVGFAQAVGWLDTADVHATRLHNHHAALYGLAFVAVLVLVRTTDQLMWLLGAVFAAGILQSVIAILLFSAGSEYVFQGVRVHHGDRATGTFANPDQLANYLGLTMAAGFGLVLAGWKRATGTAPRGWRGSASVVVAFILSPRMLVRLLLVLGVITLVLTRSRMGNAAFFLVVPVVGLLLMWRSREMRKASAVLVISLLVVDVVVVGQWVGLARVVDRLERTEIARTPPTGAEVPAGDAHHYVVAPPPREETLEQRVQAARDLWHAVEQRPWAGWGAGTFFVIFPQFRSSEAHVGWNYPHVHSDYVEIAAELGLPTLLALAVAWLATLVRCVQLLSDRSSPPVRGLAAGAAVAMLFVFVHVWVDFHLHITANAYTLTVLMAAVWAAPGPAPARRPNAVRKSGKP